MSSVRHQVADSGKALEVVSFTRQQRNALEVRSHAHNCAISAPVSDQSLRGQPLAANREKRLPTGLPSRYYDVLERVAYEEGFPVISRFSAGITSSSGNSITRQGISLP